MYNLSNNNHSYSSGGVKSDIKRTDCLSNAEGFSSNLNTTMSNVHIRHADMSICHPLVWKSQPE